MNIFLKDIKRVTWTIFSVGLAIGWGVSSLFKHLLWEPHEDQQ